MKQDKLIIGGHEFDSRFILGSGKYSLDLINAAVQNAGAQIITLALRRTNTNDTANILDYIPEGVTLLPNTSGARNAEEAVRIARLAREVGCGDFVKIEVIHDSKYLLPDNYETIKATEILAKEGFVVMPYMYPDLNAARDLVNAGAAAVMPLGSPIGSNKGICTKDFIQILIDEIDLPIIVDAGIGKPSQACEAMEMGAAAVMANTAIATAGYIHAIAAAFILISAFSCVKGSYQTSYRAICTFETADTVKDFSNGIYNKSDIYQGGGVLKFCSKRTDDGEFTGGFAVCCRKDTIYKEGYMPKSPFYVADTTGAAKSACYAVFYDNRGRMPEHSIEFVSRANGTCIPIGLYVVNTNLVVNTVKFGTSYGPAFKQGDWMKLTITGKRGTTTTGTVSVDLAKYDEKGLTVLTDWTAVPTDKLGAVEYIDLSIETNRYDIPTYCCIDNVVADVSLSME